MNRWANKVAVVTGASSGIGAACVEALLKAGLVTVGLARRENRLNELKSSFPENIQNRFHIKTCDVSKENDVKEAFNWINTNLGGTNILINNAGILKSGELVGVDNSQSIIDTVNTNILGVYFCTREAFQSMKKNGSDGHVVLLNSTAGHTAYFGDDPSYNIYCGTKHAITAMTETYRQEFQRNGTNVKVTSVSPGNVKTEIYADSESFDDAMGVHPVLEPQDIADAILYAIGTPKHVQIHEIIIKPMGEKYF